MSAGVSCEALPRVCSDSSCETTAGSVAKLLVGGGAEDATPPSSSSCRTATATPSSAPKMAPAPQPVGSPSFMTQAMPKKQPRSESCCWCEGHAEKCPKRPASGSPTHPAFERGAALRAPARALDQPVTLHLHAP